MKQTLNQGGSTKLVDPRVLNHNTVLTAASLLEGLKGVELQNKDAALAQTKGMIQRASQLEYRTPLEVQTAVFGLQHDIGITQNPLINEGLKAINLGAELHQKLPVFDLEKLAGKK